MTAPSPGRPFPKRIAVPHGRATVSIQLGKVYMSHLLVDEAYRGNGLGTALVRMAQELATEEGRPLVVYARRALRPWYASMGFVMGGGGDQQGLKAMMWEPS